jgi:hypothetical protein
MARYRWYLLGVSAVIVLVLTSCATSLGVAPAAAAANVAMTSAAADVDGGLTAPARTPVSSLTGELSAAEIEGVLYMREEEKLARDVYLALYERWGTRIFQNIAQSETAHMEAVLTLIERYGLEDPAAGKEVGVFTNETLQELYDELVAQGEQSLAAALRVGAAIEEIDILDLEAYISQTNRTDIRRVYESLTRGSRNHLRAFVRNLEWQTGEAYEPQYLDQAAYEAIVNGGTERGQGRGS